MELSKLIRKLRLEASLTQKEVGERARTPQAYISQIESGKRECSERMLEDILIKGIGLSYRKARKTIREWKLEKIGLPCRLAELVETEFVVVPMLGSVPCGDPRKDLKDAESYFSLPASIAEKGHRVFAVNAEGLSMVEENIFPEDIVVCDADAELKDGDLAIVRVDGKAALKRVFFKEDYVELRAGNKGFDPIKVKKGKVKIVGKVIYLIKKT